MILGADARQTEGRWLVAVKGWQEEAPLSLAAILRRFAGRELREAIVTDIGRDGMLQGPTTGLYVRLQAAFPQVTFTVSGGVSSMDDIRALDAAGLRKAIVGKALYENRITLKDIALWSQKESYPASM
jgi:phosphoribosylformimino-5-aminoimidazole carboxamide ribotide isomerase